MKVLFIGGTGNISSAVSETAVKKGIDLYILTRGSSSISIAGATQIIADINDPDKVKSILAGHTWDVIVNCIAFKAEDVKRDLELFLGKTSQYIFISSASCYQKPPASPYITESTPLENPFWKYSRDKITCENFLMDAYRENNFPVTIVRPSLTYNTVIPVPIGGWTEYTIIDRIKKGKKIIVHGDGTSLWTMTHAMDFAEGLTGLFGNQQAHGQAFHITSDEILTWNQIYEAIAAAAGKKPQMVHIPSEFIAHYDPSREGSLLGDKAVSVIFDNTKIKRYVPGFKCKTGFREGIRKTIEWFEKEPSRMIIKEETNNKIDFVISKFETGLK